MKYRRKWNKYQELYYKGIYPKLGYMFGLKDFINITRAIRNSFETEKHIDYAIQMEGEKIEILLDKRKIIK
ncbi:MAG: hypothetical protein WC358_00125 [Ignavibacteria bacterium]|jgi:hypothetical protein